ncbi:hypothetical protein HELRODRAFT_103700 [Helobdella robusta]|uniref:EF-hand domain-containing protein n=1 Tax=Helobdella robusta TaxID=6412 RepID=T1EDG9_HELRO|nr:hypothetical protein HELRODRAFT_103700 [Helobdella robusta]ESN92494.1 hypothetical protein HELRODRAFT_103700 [Helobdella robusta]
MSSTSLNEEDRKRYEKLFQELDKNKDGSIEISELSQALSQLYGGKGDFSKHAADLVKKADINKDNRVNFSEFLGFLHDHERQLTLAFSHLDRNKDGRIDAEEVREAFKQMDLHIGIEEAQNLTKKIDKDGSLSLDWEEWRNFFQLMPSANLEDMIVFWRQSLMIDIGESMTVPPEFTKKEKSSGQWWRLLVSGGVAGLVSRTATAPLDRVKVFYMVHGKKVANSGLLNVVRQMIREGGVRSLWRGNGTNVIKIAPDTALKFFAYEHMKKLICGDDGSGSSKQQITVKDRFLAGSSAGAFSQTTIYPMEVIKTRLAIGKSGQYNGMLDCARKIYKHEGLKAFYRGFIPNLVGIIPYAGIDLATYETLKTFYMARNPDKSAPGVLVLLGCGTMSSSLGQIFTYPLSLVRTKMQSGLGADGKNDVVSISRQIMEKEGLLGFYRGLAPNFLKVLPAVGISYVVYEHTKSYLMK